MKTLILRLFMSIGCVMLTSSTTAPDPDKSYFDIRGEQFEEKHVVETVEKYTIIPCVPTTGYSDVFEQTIAFIKKHEGFAGGKAYYCAAGYKTINPCKSLRMAFLQGFSCS